MTDHLVFADRYDIIIAAKRANIMDLRWNSDSETNTLHIALGPNHAEKAKGKQCRVWGEGEARWSGGQQDGVDVIEYGEDGGEYEVVPKLRIRGCMKVKYLWSCNQLTLQVEVLESFACCAIVGVLSSVIVKIWVYMQHLFKLNKCRVCDVFPYAASLTFE